MTRPPFKITVSSTVKQTNQAQLWNRLYSKNKPQGLTRAARQSPHHHHYCKDPNSRETLKGKVKTGTSSFFCIWSRKPERSEIKEGERHQCLLLAASLYHKQTLPPSVAVSVRARDLVHLCVTKGNLGDEQDGGWMKAIRRNVKKKQNNIHGKEGTRVSDFVR